MEKLFFFTNSYPYGNDTPWKTNELNTLRKYFDVTLVPFNASTDKVKIPKFKNVNYLAPIFNKLDNKIMFYRFVSIIFNRHAFFFLKVFFVEKVYTNKIKIISWIRAAYKMLILANNKNLKNILKKADENTVLYFFWGKETSEIIPILDKTKYKKIIVRYHGYDLYEERNSNYIPFRQYQLKKIDHAIFVSEQGARYLKQKYKKIKFSYKVFRLGTLFYGKAKQSTDGTLRIISCSSVIPLKRVQIIAKALIKSDFRIEWTHIGAGHGFDELTSLVKECPENIKIKLAGQVPASDVIKYYVGKNVDLFINVSTSEGVPVSIMEAFSAGIPVLATNVGGTSEIVNEGNGKLLPSDLSADYLLNEIENFYNLPSKEKENMRNIAYSTFKNLCDFKKNTKKLVKFLLSPQ
jgi:glycosyltransferase involved in cell wall biosynthesis